MNAEIAKRITRRWFFQECGVGLVAIRRGAERLAFEAPPLRRSGTLPPEMRERIARALGLGVGDIRADQWVDNGPAWCAVMLHSAAQVLALRPDFALLGDLMLGVVGAHPPGHDAQFEVRAFAPGLGVPEDPVTGSLNAGLARWLIGAGLAPARYVATQGAALQRAGRVHVEQDADTTWIGGDVAPCIEGEVEL